MLSPFNRSSQGLGEQRPGPSFGDLVYLRSTYQTTQKEIKNGLESCADY
ncbi:hypothetical protein SynMVIR181_01023 [Synechococcus sp. MVIR-18-1]|nr:hypothetical protein SynMVIR181_01023 [Synechococcus sp. MVIR-18-1]